MSVRQAVINFVVNTRSAKEQISSFKSSFKAATQEMSHTFVGKFGAIGAAFGGFRAIKDIFDQTRKLTEFAQSFSVPVEQVSKFANTLSMFGGSSDTAVADLERVQQAIVDFRTTGGGALKAVSAQIGMSLYTADGKIKNSVQVIEGLREKFKGLSESAQLKVAQELGLSDPATLSMLRASDAEYKKMRADAEKMNVVNSKTAERVQTITRILAQMKQQWFAIGATLLEYVEKPLNMVIKAMEWFNGLSEQTKGMITGIVGALILMKPALDVLTFFKGGITALIAPLKLVFGLMAANPILATISALALGIVYFDEIKAALDAFLSSGTPFAEFCKGIVENLKMILTPFEAVGNAVGWVASKIGGIFGGKKQEDLSKLPPEELERRRAMIPLEEEDEERSAATIPTGGEIAARQNANIVNSTTTINNSASNATKNNTVTQTFNFNGIGQSEIEKLQAAIRQGTTGVSR